MTILFYKKSSETQKAWGVGVGWGGEELPEYAGLYLPLLQHPPGTDLEGNLSCFKE